MTGLEMYITKMFLKMLMNATHRAPEALELQALIISRVK
jgi:hypothetical protein